MGYIVGGAIGIVCANIFPPMAVVIVCIPPMAVVIVCTTGLLMMAASK